MLVAAAIALLLAGAGDAPPAADPPAPPVPPDAHRPPAPGEAPDLIPARAEREPGLHLAGLPLASFGSDVGLQLGGAAYLYDANRAGERESWGALGFSWTTSGPRSLELKGELLRLFGTSLRTFLQAKGSVDTSAPYWGEGAALGAGVAPGAGSPPAAYRYEASGPWLSAIVRGPLRGPLQGWTRVRWSDVAVARAPPLLVRNAPLGFRGGSSTIGYAGVAWDTRQGGASPTRGILADASAFTAPPALGTAAFAGVDVGVRAYVPLSASTVLAVRGLYDLKVGDVPFFERALYEGLTYGEGLGGAGTIRGLARDRLMGEEKALASVELRSWLGETRWLGRPQAWGVSAGGDAGRARDGSHAPVLGVGGFVGGRLLWDRAVVMRLELGYAGQGAPAVYIGFDEAF